MRSARVSNLPCLSPAAASLSELSVAGEETESRYYRSRLWAFSLCIPKISSREGQLSFQVRLLIANRLENTEHTTPPRCAAVGFQFWVRTSTTRACWRGELRPRVAAQATRTHANAASTDSCSCLRFEGCCLPTPHGRGLKARDTNNPTSGDPTHLKNLSSPHPVIGPTIAPTRPPCSIYQALASLASSRNSP